jgi:pre-mRNA-splicing factor ATP-dependent RNA helicase DHX15/PRP43
MAILKKMIHNNSKQKIVIMSATIDASKFMHFFNTDALINVKGRSYPT